MAAHPHHVSGPDPRSIETTVARRRLAHALADLVERVDAKEGYAHRHARRVAGLAVSVADRLGLDHEAVTAIHLGALLHDVGKLCVPDELLRKPGPLTTEEWTVVRRHSEAGEQVLGPFLRLSRLLRPRLAADVLAVVRSHHERWDGGGYPDGTAGKRIPLGARIVGVCDAFEAMTAARVYRAPVGRDEALRELADNAGSQFDALCVEALLAAMAADAGPGTAAGALRIAPTPA
jgi:HD-GYP domain-containing protein (c-di-GMP phosphodiesterase class II)